MNNLSAAFIDLCMPCAVKCFTLLIYCYPGILASIAGLQGSKTTAVLIGVLVQLGLMSIMASRGC